MRKLNISFNDEDLKRLEDMMGKTGYSLAKVIKLAVRTMNQSAMEKKNDEQPTDI